MAMGRACGKPIYSTEAFRKLSPPRSPPSAGVDSTRCVRSVLGMNEPNTRSKAVVEATNYLINRQKTRTGQVAGAVVGKVLDQEGGKLTGRVVVAILVVLAVVGIAFVAYRLLVLDLILTVIREQN
ncbi:hypothetical protein Aab01nite_70870 [Paractinoplanes abujensis]|nr:hypothetical protein Aab01nite_70870 [Actinoplanes abujensis]